MKCIHPRQAWPQVKCWQPSIPQQMSEVTVSIRWQDYSESRTLRKSYKTCCCAILALRAHSIVELNSTIQIVNWQVTWLSTSCNVSEITKLKRKMKMHTDWWIRTKSSRVRSKIVTSQEPVDRFPPDKHQWIAHNTASTPSRKKSGSF